MKYRGRVHATHQQLVDAPERTVEALLVTHLHGAHVVPQRHALLSDEQHLLIGLQVKVD